MPIPLLDARYDPPQLLGERTDSILREVLQLDAQSVEKLKEQKTV